LLDPVGRGLLVGVRLGLAGLRLGRRASAAERIVALDVIQLPLDLAGVVVTDRLARLIRAVLIIAAFGPPLRKAEIALPSPAL